MFNLDHAIAEWRRQMSSGGIKSRHVLDELESHLREDVEQQMRSGAKLQKAFENAVRQIGQAGALRTEFAKISRTKGQLRLKLRNFWLRFLGAPAVAPDDLTAGAREALE